jgi:predicted DNA-binding protein (MmcQ/YjbR family)
MAAVQPVTFRPLFPIFRRSFGETGTPLLPGRLWWHNQGMTRLIVNSFCITLPGAEVSDPWGGGHDAWKVGGKMFACIGAAGGGVSVKTPDIDTAHLLIEMGHATRAPYFHASWVRVPWGLVPDDELRERLDASYWLIRATLPKKVQAAL